MKCFIHLNEEAVAVCKKCGKAMCENCSAYTNHSGICPECKRDEFISERNVKYAELRKNKNATILSIVLAVLFAVAAIALAIVVTVYMLAILAITAAFGIRVAILYVRRKPIVSRINYLTGEINKLNVALQRGTAQI